MMFDLTVRVGEGVVQVLQDENGENQELHLIFPVLMLLPVGPNQFAPVQTGVLKIPMDKANATQTAENLAEGADALPIPKKPSDLVVAGDMSQAQQLDEMQRKTTGR